MSNKQGPAKTKITKISAQPKATVKNASESADRKPNSKDAKKARTKDRAPEKPLKEVSILARPFVAIGRYLRDSWREIRQVRWPSRKATWKMTVAVLVYCAIFIVFIMLLDTFFTFIFNLLLGTA